MGLDIVLQDRTKVLTVYDLQNVHDAAILLIAGQRAGTNAPQFSGQHRLPLDFQHWFLQRFRVPHPRRTESGETVHGEHDRGNNVR